MASGTFIDQLKDLLAYLEIDRCHLAGLSMGGVVAQGFARTEHDRLKTLILMNTVYRRTEAELLGMRARLELTREEGLKPIADAAIARWFDPHFQKAYPERIETIRRKMLSNQFETVRSGVWRACRSRFGDKGCVNASQVSDACANG